MKVLRTLTASVSIILAILVSSAALAMPDNVRMLRLKDQHETPFRVPSNTRFILFAHDMSSKNLVQDMLSSKPATFLEERNALFIADISGMPRVIARMFAYPALRKLPYTILLDEVGTQTGDWERKDSAVTLFTINNYQVSGYRHIDQVEELLDALALNPQDESNAPAADAAEDATVVPEAAAKAE